MLANVEYDNGLGALNGQAANTALAVGSTAATAATPAIASAVFGSGVAGAALPAFAIPVIGAAIGGVTLAIGMYLNRKGPKQKVWSSQIVDQEEVFLKQNLAAWEQSNKTVAEQEACLNNFLMIWEETKAKLNVPELGEPGQRGIRDRDKGGKWDWWNYYYYPIANDPNVKPNPTIAQSVGESFSNLTDNIGLPSLPDMGGMGMLALGGILLVVGFSGFFEGKN